MMFQSRLYKIPNLTAKRKMESLISAFDLQNFRKHPVSSYSGGVKRRLDIALTMMSDPKILFLDEPTVGMDIQSRIRMWDMLKKIQNDFETTIFLTTHYLEEAEQLSNTICIMKDGKALLQGSPTMLCSYIQQESIQVLFPSAAKAKQQLFALREHFATNTIVLKNTRLIFQTQNIRTDIEKVTMYLIEHHIHFQEVSILQPTLEDVFLRLPTEYNQEVL